MKHAFLITCTFRQNNLIASVEPQIIMHDEQAAKAKAQDLYAEIRQRTNWNWTVDVEVTKVPVCE